MSSDVPEMAEKDKVQGTGDPAPEDNVAPEEMAKKAPEMDETELTLEETLKKEIEVLNAGLHTLQKVV